MYAVLPPDRSGGPVLVVVVVVVVEVFISRASVDEIAFPCVLVRVTTNADRHVKR